MQQKAPQMANVVHSIVSNFEAPMKIPKTMGQIGASKVKSPSNSIGLRFTIKIPVASQVTSKDERRNNQ